MRHSFFQTSASLKFTVLEPKGRIFGECLAGGWCECHICLHGKLNFLLSRCLLDITNLELHGSVFLHISFFLLVCQVFVFSKEHIQASVVEIIQTFF